MVPAKEQDPTPVCPSCDRAVPADSAFRPFCSKRCQLVDLGRWLDGKYVIPGPDAVDFGVRMPDDGAGDDVRR